MFFFFFFVSGFCTGQHTKKKYKYYVHKMHSFLRVLSFENSRKNRHHDLKGSYQVQVRDSESVQASFHA